MKDTENYPDLLKVPDSVIIKELRIELGKANSYVDELKHELKNLKEKNLKTEENIRKNEHIKGLENKNKKLTERIQILNYENTGLKLRINNLHSQLR